MYKNEAERKAPVQRHPASLHDTVMFMHKVRNTMDCTPRPAVLKIPLHEPV